MTLLSTKFVHNLFPFQILLITEPLQGSLRYVLETRGSGDGSSNRDHHAASSSHIPATGVCEDEAFALYGEITVDDVQRIFSQLVDALPSLSCAAAGTVQQGLTSNVSTLAC